MTIFEILPNCIRKSKRLSAKKTYVIQGEVRVLKNVRLTIDDQVKILLVNGTYPKSCTKRSTLIFDQGSKLSAKRVHLFAANKDFKLAKHADNGGLWFIGNYANASKDGIGTKVNRKNAFSYFSAKSITTKYLGRKDQYISPKSGKLIGTGDDIDGISLLGVGPNEFSIDSIKSYFSADDGIDLTNSHVKLMNLEVKAPTEDGINLSSSRLEIHRKLVLDSPKSKEIDRDLFDFETDNGASYLELYTGCHIKLNGVFGDQVILSSKEMPRPNTKTDNEKPYYFEGKLKQAALIYSIDQD